MTKRFVIAVLVAALVCAAILVLCLTPTQHRPRSRFWAHGTGKHSSIHQLCFSRDGTILFASDLDKTSQWDLIRMQRVRSFPGSDIVLSHDGTMAATVCDDIRGRQVRGLVKLWDSHSGKELAALKHPDPIHSIAFSPREAMLAVVTEGRTKLESVGEQLRQEPGQAYLWNTKTTGIHVSFKAHDGAFSAVVFSPDGALLATASDDKAVWLWDVASGRTSATFLGHEAIVQRLAFSCDGRILVSSCPEGVRLWNVITGNLVSCLNAQKVSERFACSLAFHPQLPLLATASTEEADIRLWDILSGKQRFSFRERSSSNFGVYAIAISGDGKTLAAGVQVGVVELWDLEREMIPQSDPLSLGPAKNNFVNFAED